MATPQEIEAAAAGIANARGARRGVPEISNILDLLEKMPGRKLYDEVMDDADAALKAVEKLRRSDPP